MTNISSGDGGIKNLHKSLDSVLGNFLARRFLIRDLEDLTEVVPSASMDCFSLNGYPLSLYSILFFQKRLNSVEKLPEIAKENNSLAVLNNGVVKIVSPQAQSIIDTIKVLKNGFA